MWWFNILTHCERIPHAELTNPSSPHIFTSCVYVREHLSSFSKFQLCNTVLSTIVLHSILRTYSLYSWTSAPFTRLYLPCPLAPGNCFSTVCFIFGIFSLSWPFFFFFFPTCRNSRARDWTHATKVTWPKEWQCWTLNLLSYQGIPFLTFLGSTYKWYTMQHLPLFGWCHSA